MATLSVTDIDAALITACIEKHFSGDPVVANNGYLTTRPESMVEKRARITQAVQGILDILNKELPRAVVGTKVCVTHQDTVDPGLDELVIPLVQRKFGITLVPLVLPVFYDPFGSIEEPIMNRYPGYSVTARV